MTIRHNHPCASSVTCMSQCKSWFERTLPLTWWCFPVITAELYSNKRKLFHWSWDSDTDLSKDTPSRVLKMSHIPTAFFVSSLYAAYEHFKCFGIKKKDLAGNSCWSFSFPVSWMLPFPQVPTFHLPRPECGPVETEPLVLLSLLSGTDSPLISNIISEHFQRAREMSSLHWGLGAQQPWIPWKVL